jgi:hypothetical protein
MITSWRYFYGSWVSMSTIISSNKISKTFFFFFSHLISLSLLPFSFSLPQSFYLSRVSALPFFSFFFFSPSLVRAIGLRVFIKVVYHSTVSLIFARLEPLNMDKKSPSLVCHPTNPCRSVGVGKVADMACLGGVVGWFLHGLVVYLGLSRFFGWDYRWGCQNECWVCFLSAISRKQIVKLCQNWPIIKGLKLVFLAKSWGKKCLVHGLQIDTTSFILLLFVF